MEYKIPKENYLTKPKKESCYEYLLAAYGRISKDYGDDYTAFVTPVANVESETSMKRLLSDVEKLASWFVSKGIGKGDVVTAFLPTCGHAAIIFYALNKIGAISNFVHPLTPPNQLVEIMMHTKSKCLFLLDLFAGPFKPITDKFLTVVCSTSDFCDGIAYKYAKGNEMQNAQYERTETTVPYLEIMAMELPAVPTDTNPGKDDAIYLHGGGTTGKSKTIIHSSYSFNSLAYAMYAIDQPHDYNTCYSLCVLPCFHAFGLGVAIHYAICNSYRPIMIPKFDPVQANELIRKYCVLEILGVPHMFQKLMAAPNFEGNEGIKNLKILCAGGDYVSPAFLDEFNSALRRHGSSAFLAAGYGLTEMAAVCTVNDVLGKEYRTDTVGHPILGTHIEIWDENCNKLPDGVEGEVVITGETMMNRYLPDDVIQETGIYTDKDGRNWVRTGDVGMITEDGHIRFTSRIKRVILISGYNIYPATIERKVLALDSVAEACACQGYDENGKPYVKLVISPADPECDREKLAEDVMSFCKENVEGYSCPRRIFVIDALPRTKMEKIDFMKLSDPVPEA